MRHVTFLLLMLISGCPCGEPAYGGRNSAADCPGRIDAFKATYCGGAADGERGRRDLARLQADCGGPEHEAALAECEGCVAALAGPALRHPLTAATIGNQ